MKVIAKFCADNIGCYVVFHKSIVFILGLIFGFKLVEILVFNIMITYLIPPSMAYDLRTLAVLVNLQAGISSVLAIFLAFVADAYIGLFNMVISASALCIGGLVLTHFALRSEDGIVFVEMVYAAVAVLTLSEAATVVTFNLFLGDQLGVAKDEALTQPLQEKRSEQRTKFWSSIVYACAYVFALFGPLKNIVWLTDLARILALLMAAVLLWFLLGFKWYNRVKTAAATALSALICNAIHKRNVAFPHMNKPISPHISWLRWVDRAALVQEERLGGSTRIYSVEQVKTVKSFLKMLPLWSTFIMLGVVLACGDTFFLEEAYSITSRQLFPIILAFKLWTFTKNIVAHISQLVVEKMNYNAQKMTLVQIGIGMLCCVAAWTQAVHRLHLERIHSDDGSYMSVYRLIPQYLLLGFMEGFSLHGLEMFFESQVSESMWRYRLLFGELVMGFSRFVSIGFIVVFHKCFAGFGKDVKSSRLDDFYVVLGGMSCVNLIVYCLIALWYQDNSDSSFDLFTP